MVDGADPGADPGPFAAAPDGFERLWTPHRLAYIAGDARPDRTGAPGGCPFCEVTARTDEDGLIVHRGRLAYVVLNLFPYNPGHLLVCPYRHVADYTELSEPEVGEVATLTRRAMTVVRSVSQPAGFNVGMNQGDVAGAGIAAHLHQHVVPRWAGDMNFLPIVGQTKAMPELLSRTRDRIAEAWPAEPGRQE
ncbi:MAG: histidine triad protein [Actinotalea sp.]|nr:histidine triad protein [Actinotalea sp.]